MLLFSPIFLSGNSFLTYYAQDFARSFNILLKVQLYSQLLNSDIIHIINLNCIYSLWKTIARLIMSQLYSCMLLVNVNFLQDQIKCADCSVRVYRSFQSECMYVCIAHGGAIIICTFIIFMILINHIMKCFLVPSCMLPLCSYLASQLYGGPQK